MTIERECPMCGNVLPSGFSDGDECLVCGYDNSQQQKTCYTISITSEHGTVSGASDGDKYPYNKSLTLSAEPDSGYVFSKWTINEVDYTSNPISISVRSDMTIVAVFEEE